jgi:FkbM family methyltransferase
MAYSLLNCRHGLMLTEDGDMISAILRIYGEWAENSYALLAPLIPNGGVIADVGANIGTLSLAFAHRVGETGSVLAFEAQRRVFYNLCANITLNNLYWIEAHHCLIGANDGTTHAPLREMDAISRTGINRGGMSFVSNLNNPQTPSGRDQLAIRTLDHFLENHGRCDLIKIDVEGAEPQVLSGLVQTLAHKRPYLYVECGSAKLLTQILSALAPHKYQLFWHPSPHFNPNNFRNSGNMTGGKGDMNLLGVPIEKLDSDQASCWQQLHQVSDWSQVSQLFAGFEF